MVKDKKSMKNVPQGAPFGGVYLVAYLGAAVYFMQTSYGFWGTALALVKALVWPAYLIHSLFIVLAI